MGSSCSREASKPPKGLDAAPTKSEAYIVLPEAAGAGLAATLAVAEQEPLLAVLDKLAHDQRVLQLLTAFISQRCMLFGDDSEHSHAEAKAHAEYRALFERCLAAVLKRAGLAEARFAVLMAQEIERGSVEAQAIMDFATAADDFVRLAPAAAVAHSPLPPPTGPAHALFLGHCEGLTLVLPCGGGSWRSGR